MSRRFDWENTNKQSKLTRVGGEIEPSNKLSANEREQLNQGRKIARTKTSQKRMSLLKASKAKDSDTAERHLTGLRSIYMELTEHERNDPERGGRMKSEILRLERYL